MKLRRIVFAVGLLLFVAGNATADVKLERTWTVSTTAQFEVLPLRPEQAS